MPRSAKGWPALRCARSPAPRGRCARRSWEAGDEGEGGRKKKKIRLGAGASAQDGQRGSGGAGGARGAALRAGGAAAAPAVRVCVCLCFTPCGCEVAPAGTELYPAGRRAPHAPELAPRRFRGYLAFGRGGWSFAPSVGRRAGRGILWVTPKTFSFFKTP